MPSFEQARHLILEHVTTLGTETLPLLQAVGAVSAEDVAAPQPMPLCDNSAMDGYAVRVADCGSLARLPLAGYLPAGVAAGQTLPPGSAMKIMTGAPIPAGCDAVVPLEDAEEIAGCVRVARKVVAGQHIRLTGEDVRPGETVVAAGKLITPSEISMLASCGKTHVTVWRRPLVAVLSTGDELIAAGEKLTPGRVIDSNGVALAAAVAACGALPAMLGIARDNRQELVARLGEGLRQDVLITSAGVSTGERDLVREVLAELGVATVFRKIEMRPGSPTYFGTIEGRPVFCLPGNPVASLITFEELVRPALLKMMGHRRVLRPARLAVLEEPTSKKPGKIKILRVRVRWENGRLLASSAGDQNTGMLKTMLMADALAILPSERASFAAGDEVEVHILSPETEMTEA